MSNGLGLQLFSALHAGVCRSWFCRWGEAVPNQIVNFPHEEGADRMAVYVRKADKPHCNCAAVSSSDSLPPWILRKEVCE